MRKFSNSYARALVSREYCDFVLASIESAVSRIWISTFIFDARPGRDVDGLVLRLIDAMGERKKIGVDVRVMLPGMIRTIDIDVANMTSAFLLADLGIPVKVIGRDESRVSSHSKFVICDNTSAIGSHNLTDDAFRINHEASAVLTGEAANYLADEFLRLWAISKGASL